MRSSFSYSSDVGRSEAVQTLTSFSILSDQIILFYFFENIIIQMWWQGCAHSRKRRDEYAAMSILTSLSQLEGLLSTKVAATAFISFVCCEYLPVSSRLKSEPKRGSPISKPIQKPRGGDPRVNGQLTAQQEQVIFS